MLITSCHGTLLATTCPSRIGYDSIPAPLGQMLGSLPSADGPINIYGELDWLPFGPMFTKPARNHEVPGSNPVSGGHRTVNSCASRTANIAPWSCRYCGCMSPKVKWIKPTIIITYVNIAAAAATTTTLPILLLLLYLRMSLLDKSALEKFRLSDDAASVGQIGPW